MTALSKVSNTPGTTGQRSGPGGDVGEEMRDVPGEPQQPSPFPGSTFQGFNYERHSFSLLPNDLSDLLQKALPKNGTLCGSLRFALVF